MSDIGALSQRLELIGITRTATAAGGWTRGDGVEMTVWAHIRIANASEQRRAERNEIRISHVARILWRPDLAQVFLTKGQRARYVDRAGRTRDLYVETAIDPDGQGDFLELQCREGGPS